MKSARSSTASTTDMLSRCSCTNGMISVRSLAYSALTIVGFDHG
jgi:hypothetical protein